MAEAPAAGPSGRPGFRFASLPIFWQTLILLIGGLVVAQLVGILLVLYLPAPRPDFYTMTELVERLANEPGSDPELRVELSDEAPDPEESGMIADPAITRRLAIGLGVPVSRARLLFEADQSETFPFARRTGRGAVPIRHGQPYFFNTVVAAVEQPDGEWRILRTPPPARLTTWQQRTVIWFGLSALIMLPFAWLFARRLTRPIRRFADAVDRLGHDEASPPVPIEGPAELQLTGAAVNAMQERLRATLRERTAMIGAIAHDLRTPLARIAFRIEAAPAAVRGPVQADIEQMRAMVAETIGFMRGGFSITAPRPIDLAALARRLAEQARETGSKVVLGPLAPVTISGDRSAIERMVQNLVDNALQYAGAAELSVSQAQGRARLQVADEGPGIPEGELERMFEPFERREPSRSRSTGGLGLGLAIARGIATAHGGTVSARNRRGGGLSVVVDLPAAA